MLFIVYKLFGKTRKTIPAGNANADFGVIVTAYQYTDSLPAVAAALLKQEYPHFLIYIVADNCDISQLQFNDERVILLRPPAVIASNTGSHFYAIHHFKRAHSHVVIMDSDNIAHPGMLYALNNSLQQGFEAVQGLRKAKNQDTLIAQLDTARDLYYHYFDGRILFALGSSATLAGSGMAFSTRLYKDCLEYLSVKGAGFDKVLQAEILKRNLRIAFTEDAIVYDEKTSRSDQLVKQRARWINTWFRYFRFGFVLLRKGFTKPSFNQTLFGIILLRPPLFIFLLLSGICMLVNLVLSPLAALAWALAFLCFIAGFFIALAESKADKKIYAALLRAPVFIFYQVLALLHIRRANKLSVATEHFHNTMDTTEKSSTQKD
jgi:cellulose synthase/poly-beta-1,6-N-acetylglucosamine synthase-like glycosyltransferase